MHRLDDNTKVHLEKKRQISKINEIKYARDRFQLQTVVNSVTNIQIPSKA
jgi:hypothetical protein